GFGRGPGAPDRGSDRGRDERGYAPRRDDARADNRDGGRDRRDQRDWRGDRRDDGRPSAQGRPGFRADRGGTRTGFGRKDDRSDEVQTIGGDGARREGAGRTGGAGSGGSRGRFGRDSSRRELRGGSGAPRGGGRPEAKPYGTRGGAPAGGARGGGAGKAGDNPFKTSRQPLRDPDFYDRDYVDERDTTEVPGGERLQKVLAQAGIASRRACEEMIGDGRVTVDGQVVRRFGARVDPVKQVIHVDGKRIPTSPELVYYALNKPIGVVSTMEDPDGRPCLQDYVQDLTTRLFHVGRLDTETEGLLLFTNDGELAHRLTHPSYGVQKKYWAKVPGPVPRDLHRVLRKGIELEDGLAKVDEFNIVQEHGQQALVEIILHEGRKHIVRRLLEASGHRVIDLARIEFGPVKLGRLKPGTIRTLTVQEVGDLYSAVGL
ncbi:pseudouridine synthase, partial [Planotetraspora silvatica]|uniref:pseudouridine synthase n=1 Tax=Planotetraspora silvatica TaxID=234614 RepID=UPI001951CC1F